MTHKDVDISKVDYGLEMAAKARLSSNNYVFEFRFSGQEYEWRVPRQPNNNLGGSRARALSRKEAVELLKKLIKL